MVDLGGQSERPATFLSAVEGINAIRKYLMGLHVVNNIVASDSSTENGCALFSRE
jgi:hypothetical protein